MFCAVQICLSVDPIDSRKCFYQIRHGHRLLATKDVPRTSQQKRSSLFTSRSSEMLQMLPSTCYQHQDGEVATEDLEIMLKYMGCILAFLALTYGAHTVEYVECWDPCIPCIRNARLCSTLFFASRFQFSNIFNSEAMRHFAEG